MPLERDLRLAARVFSASGISSPMGEGILGDQLPRWQAANAARQPATRP
jgi:hypothetical protein